MRGSTGRPVPGYELRLTDEEGRVLDDGPAVGALEVRGDSCAAFYWHQHEKTKASMRGDWFTTADRFRCTADGVYVYEGRTDDMLRSAACGCRRSTWRTRSWSTRSCSAWAWWA